MKQAGGTPPDLAPPLLALHASLALRIAGDLLPVPDWRRWGGLRNALALLLFLVNTVGAIIRGRR